MTLHEPHTALSRKGPPRPQDAIAPFTASADNSFEMTTEDDIGDALTLLAEHGDAISMYAPGSREPIFGRILSVDPQLPHFVMEMNEGAVLPSGKITFVTTLRSAKLQFRLSKDDWDPLPGQPLHIPMVFPETCTVLNRRSTERLETPLGITCTAAFAVSETNFHELPVYDISMGGLGMHCSKARAKGLIKGRKLHDVVLEMGEITIEVAEMEIRFTRSFRSFLAGEQLHLGCMFTKLTPEATSKIETVLDQIRNP